MTTALISKVEVELCCVCEFKRVTSLGRDVQTVADTLELLLGSCT